MSDLQVPELLGTTENELGIRSWLESQGHTLVTTSDKEGENSKFDQELVDAEIIITTPYISPPLFPLHLLMNSQFPPRLPHRRTTRQSQEPQASHHSRYWIRPRRFERSQQDQRRYHRRRSHRLQRRFRR